MTPATLNLGEVAEFWRVARRLYAVYVELDRTFELDMPSCRELDDTVDHPEIEARERVLQWFDQIDGHVQVWQLRQLLQSTNLQNEENLRYLIARHLEKPQKSEADKDKIDFLLVQYFAHCAPHGPSETALAEVARVLEPAMKKIPESFPDWARSLDDKLHKLNESHSLEELQNSGALQEVRELKLALGDEYFEPGFLVVFTRFNFLARRAFFQAMHLDLHAIREAVNELERLGYASVDCRDAGLTENESLEQVRHVVHQWKTPFRAPYSGGSSFLQLILLRHALQHTLENARANAPVQAHQVSSAEPIENKDASATSAAPEQEDAPASTLAGEEAISVSAAETAVSDDPAASDLSDLISRPASSAGSSEPNTDLQAEEESYLVRCVRDIAEQLQSVPARNFPSVSAILLGGCKLLIATWEAQAFGQSDETSKALQRTVAARTILHVCMERHKKNEPTDLGAAMDIARGQIDEMKVHVEAAKEAKNIDSAVNLAATTKRLSSLIAEGEKIVG
ncbi:MAG TPA: hypothetical protein VGK24_14365 [Candidatus Angelobacter sp.]|jgi:hypothetical protein